MDKKYVGITARSPVSRWGRTGSGYMDNPEFWHDIKRFGWDNFTHEIVASALDCQTACRLESDLIQKYDTMNPDKGYNRCSGGQWNVPSDRTREKLRMIQRNRPVEVNIKMSQSLKGHVCSEETRLKISQANMGKSRNLGCKRSDEVRKHLSEVLKGRPAWNKGLNKYNNPVISEYSNRLKGRQFSKEHRRKISINAVHRYANGPKMVWMNDGIHEYCIPYPQIRVKLNEGYMMGRLPDMVYIYKGEVSKKVPKVDVSRWINDGWVVGRPQTTLENVKKSRQQYWWILDQTYRFPNAKELAQHLREQEGLSIVDSTITNLYNRGFIDSPVYYFLEGRITRETVRHEDT